MNRGKIVLEGNRINTFQMRTKLIILFSFCLCLFQIQAQVKVKLSETKNVKTVDFKEVLKIPIRFELTGSYLPSKEDEIKVKIMTNEEVLNRFLVKKEFELFQSSVVDTLVFKDEKDP